MTWTRVSIVEMELEELLDSIAFPLSVSRALVQMLGPGCILIFCRGPLCNLCSIDVNQCNIDIFLDHSYHTKKSSPFATSDILHPNQNVVHMSLRKW
jgi:hypothetical protein